MVTFSPMHVSVNCPPGAYTDRLRCVPCEKGQYQDKEGQMGCKPCPANKTTALPGASSIEECKGKICVELLEC